MLSDSARNACVLVRKAVGSFVATFCAIDNDGRDVLNASCPEHAYLTTSRWMKHEVNDGGSDKWVDEKMKSEVNDGGGGGCGGGDSNGAGIFTDRGGGYLLRVSERCSER